MTTAERQRVQQSVRTLPSGDGAARAIAHEQPFRGTRAGEANRWNRWSRAGALGTLALAMAAVVGCGAGGVGGGGDPGPGVAASGAAAVADSGMLPAATPPDTEAATVGRTDGTAGDTAAVSGGTRRQGSLATLRATRSSPPSSDRHPERVVFEFDGASPPEYEVGYATPPLIRCGSGEPVAVEGAAVLRVRLRRTRAHDELPSGELRATITERDRLVGLPLLRQLTLTCDFEGEVEWLIGLSRRVPFQVMELERPARLVVDLGG